MQDGMIGRDVANYRITALLGEGGMGLVYLAEHTTIERKVAIKILRGELGSSPELTGRFINEARVASSIKHPNVIEVFDTGVLRPDGVPYFVMELLEGEPLNKRIARVGQVDLADALRWTNETAAALAAAHAKGIIHRDLKPENLFLVGDPDGRDRIKVLDFGIAKLRGGMITTMHTQPGAVMGTPRYMSPEQCRGAKEIDNRSDIYSLGVILYQLLCGTAPFVAEGYGEIAMHLTIEPAPLRSRNPAVSEALEKAVMRALAKNPDDRFATVQELQIALGFEPARAAPTPALGSSALGAPGGGVATPSRSVTPGSRPATGTQVQNPSIVLTPAGAGAGAGAAAPSPSGRRRAPLMAAAVAVAGLAIFLGVAHGQVGPRVRCLTGGGCTDLGDCYDGGRCGLSTDQPRACEIYDADCSAGHTASCVRLGHCYEAHTGGLDTSWKHACDLYDQACGADSMEGCAHLADCFHAGIGGREKNASRACSLARRACDSGALHGCFTALSCDADGPSPGSPGQDRRQICDSGKRGCDGGDQVGCALLASCHMDVEHRTPGYEQAAKGCAIAKASCEAGGTMSCALLAACYRDGLDGFPHSEQRACELSARACDDGGFAEEDACRDLAACQREGKGGFARDEARAVSVRQRTCDDGAVRECARLAADYASGGPGIPRDAARACALHERACAGGQSCLESARCHCTGAGGARDAARAHALFRKACAGGDKTACDEDKAARCGAEPIGGAAPAGSPAPSPLPAARGPAPGLLPAADARKLVRNEKRRRDGKREDSSKLEVDVE